MEQKTVKYVIGFLVTICTLIGLNSNMYSLREKRFYVSYCLMAWCITLMIVFGMVYVNRFYNEIVMDQLDLNSAITLYYYMNVLGTLTNYISQLIVRKSACDYFNATKLFEVLNYFSTEAIINRSIMWLALSKIILFPLVIETTLILKQLYNDDKEKNLLWTFYTLFPLLMANIIPNCFFGVMVICRQAIKALNDELQKLARETNLLQKSKQMLLHKHFYRMQRFCHLADKLDELSLLFSLICEQTLNYLILAGPPLMTSLLCNLFGVTAGFFQQYYALADTFNNNKSYDIFNALTNGVFLVISFLEIAMHSLVVDQSIEAAKNTGLILKRIQLDYVDIRFKQSVEKFSLEILVINFKILPMGLLKINLGLSYSVLSTVASFLLILIQSDLALRFSLK